MRIKHVLMMVGLAIAAIYEIKPRWTLGTRRLVTLPALFAVAMTFGSAHKATAQDLSDPILQQRAFELWQEISRHGVHPESIEWGLYGARVVEKHGFANFGADEIDLANVIRTYSDGDGDPCIYDEDGNILFCSPNNGFGGAKFCRDDKQLGKLEHLPRWNYGAGFTYWSMAQTVKHPVMTPAFTAAGGAHYLLAWTIRQYVSWARTNYPSC